MKKNKRLLNRLILALVILSFIFLISLIVNSFYSYEQNRKENKLSSYYNINLLMDEIKTEVNELVKLNSLYYDTLDVFYQTEYNNIISVYTGDLIRSKDRYVVFTDVVISYRELLLNEVKKFDNKLLPNAEELLMQIDNTILSNNKLLSNLPRELSDDEKNRIKIEMYNSSQILEQQINQFVTDVISNNNTLLVEINSNINVLQYSWYIIVLFIFIYGILITYIAYSQLIKPIMEGTKLVEEISMGKEDLHWDYKYNNEMRELINSFNNYFSISQSSLNVIKEQYNRLKIYSDIGEINYFEANQKDKTIRILYSKKFADKYNQINGEVLYKIDEYLSYIHEDDYKNLFKGPKNIKDLLETRIEYRIKYPNSLDSCYVQAVAQVHEDNPDIIIGIQVDITDVKKAELILKQQEEQYRLIIENSTDFIVKFSNTGEVLFASKSYREYFPNINNPDINNISSKLLDKVNKPPFSCTDIVSIDTIKGVRWISWNSDAILDENCDVISIISVGHDITEIKKMNDRLKYETEHDILTGLLNRRGLFNALENLKNLDVLAAFFIDINNFKNINDFYGHEIGDIIIQKVANELLIFEEYKCIISRLSGDEFVVLLPNYSNTSSLNIVKAMFKKILQKNYHINNNSIFITSSVGYAIYPYDTDDLSKLISYADIAMYEAKVAHKYDCVRFTKGMFDVVNDKVEMANDLKKAIDNDEFNIVFQPIMNVVTNEIDSFESLVRWSTPKGERQPAEFLPIAEETGFIYRLDMLIIKKVLKIFYNYKESSFNNHKIAINVAPIMLMKKDFPEKLVRLTKSQKINNGDIIVEISENTFVHNVEECSIQIKRLREKGFLVALDDFGREYSSLSILEKVEFDIIKIDMMFSSNLDNGTNIEIIKMVNKIANIRNKIVIVEGVETERQRERLLQLGCTLQQGFYFSLPKRMDITE